jgi:hypothetical protein
MLVERLGDRPGDFHLRFGISFHDDDRFLVLFDACVSQALMALETALESVRPSPAHRTRKRLTSATGTYTASLVSSAVFFRRTATGAAIY